MAGSIYSWSVTAADNATADGTINWAENQLPSTVNNSSRAEMAAVASLVKDLGGGVVTGGSANAQTATMNVSFTLATGRIIVVKAGFSNTTAATLNVNATAAKAIKKYTASGEADIAANEIRAGGIYHLVYDASANSTSGAWMLLNPTLASMSTQSASAVAITGGAIDGTAIGGSTPAAGAFTTLSASGLISADGGQIAFPASQNASAGANTLDDYEEGTFTPAMTFGGGNTGITYSFRTGRYTKVGNVVRFVSYVALSSKGSSTGNAAMTGLPFTGVTSAGLLNPVASVPSSMTSAVDLCPAIGSAATSVNLYYNNAGNATNTQDTHFANNSEFGVAGTYEAA